MWLLVVSAPLLPAIFMVSRRYRVKVSALCHRALAWALRLLRGRVCVKSTHAFVFSRCTHGKADSVLQTYDLYADTHPSLCISPHTRGGAESPPPPGVGAGDALWVQLCAPAASAAPAGRLITVELDPLTAELGEEIILVSGFKHSQFQVLTSSSAEAIQTLPSLLTDLDKGPVRASVCTSLTCCLWRERSSSAPPLLRPPDPQEARDLREILDHIGARPDCYCIKSERQGVTEIFYQKGSTGLDR
ncbi:hypothetical protein F7725_010542 [Dissostichus mawsoni]|uniref:Uncharacterized protein n=1 Tax=Dissostichus mawsoni TaxID=36200 RepID=A0A7J5XNX7_DISMA|nr:hypothetical protein F7725_010542 [Dissostichus mawsoni]